MGEVHLLQELLIVLTVTITIVILFQKMRLPAIVGFLFEGRRLDELNGYLIGATTDIVSVLEDSASIGQSLRQIDLRKRTGATVIAAVRDGKPAANVGPDLVLQAGDLLVVLGNHKALDDAAQLINPPSAAGEGESARCS